MVLIALFCGSAFAQDPPPPVKEYNASAWKEFKSTEGKFSVSLPGIPKPDVRTMDTGIGKLTTHSFALQTDLGTYYIAYIEFPASPTTPEETRDALDSARDHALAGGGRLLDEKDIRIDGGGLGRELLVENHGWIMKARYFYFKDCLYQIIFSTLPEVVFKNGKPSANAADRTELFEMVSKKFFDSLKVTR